MNAVCVSMYTHVPTCTNIYVCIYIDAYMHCAIHVCIYAQNNKRASYRYEDNE